MESYNKKFDVFQLDIIEDIKKRYPEFTYKAYIELREEGFPKTDIKRIYQLSTRSFDFFINNHIKVLGDEKFE